MFYSLLRLVAGEKDPPATCAVKVSLIKSSLMVTPGEAMLTLPGSQEPSYSPLRGKKHTAAKHRCQRFHPRPETFSRPSAMRNTLNGKPVCPKAEGEA